MALVEVRNLSTKPVEAIGVDFVFHDSATDREFLTYNLQLDQQIREGKTKELRHKIGRRSRGEQLPPE